LIYFVILGVFNLVMSLILYTIWGNDNPHTPNTWDRVAGVVLLSGFLLISISVFMFVFTSVPAPRT
jgi:hypothetical protein